MPQFLIPDTDIPRDRIMALAKRCINVFEKNGDGNFGYTVSLNAEKLAVLIREEEKVLGNSTTAFAEVSSDQPTLGIVCEVTEWPKAWRNWPHLLKFQKKWIKTNKLAAKKLEGKADLPVKPSDQGQA